MKITRLDNDSPCPTTIIESDDGAVVFDGPSVVWDELADFAISEWKGAVEWLESRGVQAKLCKEQTFTLGPPKVDVPRTHMDSQV